MSFRTMELLEQANTSPKDEASVNNAERQFADKDSARDAYQRVKSDLFDISHWNNKSGLSTYELFDPSGNPANESSIAPGKFIKITLSGSGKSDWVRVEDIYDSGSEAVITVRPTHDPTEDTLQTGEISHFFTNDATNNFCVLHEDRVVSIFVIGLNEKVNTAQTGAVVETIRNAAVANLGHYLGIQKAEWAKFCRSFLYDGEESAE